MVQPISLDGPWPTSRYLPATLPKKITNPFDGIAWIGQQVAKMLVKEYNSHGDNYIILWRQRRAARAILYNHLEEFRHRGCSLAGRASLGYKEVPDAIEPAVDAILGMFNSIVPRIPKDGERDAADYNRDEIACQLIGLASKTDREYAANMVRVTFRAGCDEYGG